MNLLEGRSGHTATVLPDGTVFVFGGTADGQIAASGEILDLETHTIVAASTTGLTPRTQHSAILLTDGRILLVGGLDANGNAIATAQLWDPRTNAVDPWNPLLQIPRYDHRASLLASGEGLIVGGYGANKQAANISELYNPSTRIFESLPPSSDPRLIQPADSAQAPAIAEALPAAEAVDVPVDTRVAVRFSRSLKMIELNASNLTVVGPTGVVPREGSGSGRRYARFLYPGSRLAPWVDLHGIHTRGHRYSRSTLGGDELSVYDSSVRGQCTEQVRPSLSHSEAIKTLQPMILPLSSSTAPEPQSGTVVARLQKTSPVEKSVAIDEVEDWSPHEENRHGQWRVLGLAGDPALDAAVNATADLSAPAGVTALAGHVMRINGKPLVGVTVSIDKASIVTDASGRFLLTGVSAGSHELLVDGSLINTKGWHYTKHYIQVSLNRTRQRHCLSRCFYCG